MAASTSPVIACARMSCQIGALPEREVHSIAEQLTSISGSIFPPEHRIGLYSCVPARFSLRRALDQGLMRIRSVRGPAVAAPLRRGISRRLPALPTDRAY